MTKKEKLPKKTFEEHYIELRNRILISALIFMICVCICFYFTEHLYNFLTTPLLEAFGERDDRKLIFTGLAEGLMTHVKLSMYAGFALSLPFIITQIYLFLAPGLYKKEKLMLLSYIFSSIALFCIGLAMVYYFVIPAAWKFFLTFESFGQKNIALPILLEARISEYLDLVLELIIGFGLAFQMPIIIVLLIKIRVLSTKSLVSFRRYAIVIIFILAAILTPPDVFSQIALALPLLLLYEVSILIGKVIERKNVGH